MCCFLKLIYIMSNNSDVDGRSALAYSFAQHILYAVSAAVFRLCLHIHLELIKSDKYNYV